jgi:hypothetical protein
LMWSGCWHEAQGLAVITIEFTVRLSFFGLNILTVLYEKHELWSPAFCKVLNPVAAVKLHVIELDVIPRESHWCSFDTKFCGTQNQATYGG